MAGMNFQTRSNASDIVVLLSGGDYGVSEEAYLAIIAYCKGYVHNSGCYAY